MKGLLQCVFGKACRYDHDGFDRSKTWYNAAKYRANLLDYTVRFFTAGTSSISHFAKIETK